MVARGNDKGEAMNIYKSLLFLHGYLLDPTLADDEFGQTYGNRVASEKALRERWESERGPAEVSAIAARVDSSSVVGCG
jgi:hypothetical protein